MEIVDDLRPLRPHRARGAQPGEKLIEEFIVVALVCLVFLFHLRSALVAIVSLPLGILAAFIVMQYQGVNANIMSLGGIAIAIGAMVDAAVVMIENAHKHLEAWHHAHPGERLEGDAHWQVIADAAAEVGPALFFSLLIITLSFVPVFTLQAQEGRLFSPLAYTKTYAMAAAAGLSVTLDPGADGLPDPRPHSGRARESAQPRSSSRCTSRCSNAVLRHPRTTLADRALLIALTTWIPISRVGGEFMPPLDEGDLLYMPTALPGLSAGKAAELLQQTDRLIRTVPEVKRVFGKAGRAETATDPAPLEMLETTSSSSRTASRVASRHDAGEADRGARRARARAGARQHLGAADPQPHRHARHRHQEPAGHQGGGDGPRDDRARDRRDRARGEGRARRELGVGRAPHRRPLHRREDRPRRRRALRHERRPTCRRS